MPANDENPTDSQTGADAGRIETAFAEVVALPTLARAAYRARLRASSPGLADEVESLLRYHERPSKGLPDDATFTLPPSLVGSEVGGCTLERLVGYGGMSAVYAATQRFPRRRVAVKIVRPERLGASAARRLRVEAEALARLEHPNIARVYAAGVERIGGKAREGANEGSDEAPESPYIVMEIIEGAVSVTKWADGQRLDARARIELVARIADAIAHAHGAGVI
ncbi:MAG: protein kinase domain-containing protein, partial [Planctomycetota bacterium]